MWDSPLLRSALARQDMAAVLAILRGAIGLSQVDMGQLLGWSQSAVGRIEYGRRHTLNDIGEILRLCDVLGMPRKALLPLILGRTDVTLDDDDADFWGPSEMIEGEMTRREFGVLAGGLAAGAVLPAPERVDRGQVRYLQASLERLRDGDRIAGGTALLHDARRLLTRAQLMLDESDYTDAVGRDLLVVTADLGIVTAWLAYDAGDQELARRLYTEAELLATHCGDPEVQVHVAVNMAQQSTYLARATGRRGAAREALRFAQQAAEAARHHPSPTLHGLIALRQALAYAELGDQIAFRRQIATARCEVDRGRHESDRRWTLFVSHSEIDGYEAMGYARLEQPVRAIPLYQRVLEDGERSPRDHAYYRARLAAATADAGDGHEAIRQGLEVLPDLGGRMTSKRVLRELAPVRDLAAKTAAEAFVEQYDRAARDLGRLSA
ncbi:helix-turn-helix domain-containing protein [Actinomadura kijaniata]|uniref:helix-turn-helix domain-containing protein n=1 Tax=Actinomadura kijaniata TaxID=46161 RepID=UPI00083160B1|nr:helix-turn-helix transcriptional regulator [Actinomadura kijaniata]